MKLFGSLAVVSSLLASPLMASPFTTEQLQEAAKIAIADFTTDHGDHADHLTGYKVWKSGDEARVKIYVGAGTSAMEFNYNCHNHDDGLECHAQH